MRLSQPSPGRTNTTGVLLQVLAGIVLLVGLAVAWSRSVVADGVDEFGNVSGTAFSWSVFGAHLLVVLAVVGLLVGVGSVVQNVAWLVQQRGLDDRDRRSSAAAVPLQPDAGPDRGLG